MINMMYSNIYTLQLGKISKKFGFIAFILYAFFTNNVANADEKFAVINIQKVTETCTVFLDIRRQMEDKSKSLSLKFDSKIDKIKER